MNGLFGYDEVEITFKGNTWTHLFVFNIVALSITITINFRPLYLFDIQHLNILKDVEVDRVTLIKNYDHLMMYLNNPFEKTLVFPLNFQCLIARLFIFMK